MGNTTEKKTKKGKRKKPLKSQASIERAAKLAENQAEALRMRRNGNTYAEISELMGVAVSTARRWVVDAIEAIPQEEAQEMRAMMVSRIDLLMKPYMLALQDFMDARTDGDGALPPPEIMVSVLRLEARRAKLLGLDFADRMIAESYAKQANCYAKQGNAYADMLKADMPILRPDAPVPLNPIL